MRRQLTELVLFSTYAELRAERARSYLGFVWWLAEPAMMMAAFWLVFDVILETGGRDYLPFLLIGLVVWQWMKSCITHAGHAIWTNLGLIRQVRVPVLIFPFVQMFADTVKFACVFVLLVAILALLGFAPRAAYAALPVLFVLIFVCAAGMGLVVAALMPLVPDLRFVIEQVLTVVMFLSGVVFALRNVPEWLVAVNPVLALLDAVRGVMMRGEWPQWQALVPAAVMSFALVAIGVGLVLRLAPRYAKTAV
jgi:lipopolysaccharide transport system permease protein